MKEFSFIYLLFGGGWFLTLLSLSLIAMSIYTWAIMIEKYLYYKALKNNTEFQKDLKFFNYDANKLYQKYSVSSAQTPYSRIFVAAYQTPKDKMDTVLTNVVEKELATAEKKAGFLSTASTIAPFIGLFGTIWGVMDVFSSIGVHGSTSLQVVAPGIGMALSTTALGLIVAIPAAFGYSLYSEKFDELESSLYRFASDIQEIVLLKRKG